MNVQQYLLTFDNYCRLGQWQKAEQVLNDGLIAQPNAVELVQALAVHYFRLNKQSESLHYFERAVELNPCEETWCNLGSALCDFENFEKAWTVLQQKPLLNSDIAFVYFLLARAAKGTGRIEQCLSYIDMAVKLDSLDADFRLFRAAVTIELDMWDSTKEDIRVVATLQLSPPQRLALAGLYLQTAQIPEANNSYRLLTLEFPDYFDAWLGLGVSAERGNDIVELQNAIDRAKQSARNPEQKLAVQQLQAKLAFRNKQFEQASSLLLDVWGNPTDKLLWKSQIGFELAQSLDKSQSYQQAWSVFNEAHELRNKLNLKFKGDTQAFDFFKMLETPLSGRWPVKIAPGHIEVDPVFVVGFPRSGTTLLEQILDSQPSLVSFDEQPFISKTLLELHKIGVSYPENLDTLGVEQIKQLRNFYFNQAKTKVAFGSTQRFVDKNPLNWARLPLIQSLFPDASIILALRHPCDVILSCYMQNLRSTVLSGSFSNFENIADLYIALANYWQRIKVQLEVPVFLLKYEDLVSQPEKYTQSVANFLDIPWNTSWLNSNNHALDKKLIHTPSYAQVLEPLNTRAIGRWQNYREFFNPKILEKLKPSIEAMGYSLD